MKGYDILSPIMAIICILLIVFALICLECILRKRISYIVSALNEDENDFETKIRKIILENPKSEIVVLCTAKSPEITTILDKLKEEFSQLHIIK